MTQPTTEKEVRIKIPPFYTFLAFPKRYKSIYGGRGAGRSWSICRMLLGMASAKKLRILCTREYQASIKESVHQLLSSQIELLGLQEYFTVTRDSIRSRCGSEFIFKGLKINPTEIKSLEGVDICFVEEAQSISNESWELLIPTIRKDGSEIWLSWNTGETKDPTYQRFVANMPDDCISKKATWRDNPYFPATLERERAYLQRVDTEAYQHVWEGEPRSISDACILKGKFEVGEFEAHRDQRFFMGSDFGFSNDPTTLIRCFILDGDLWIDYEAVGIGVELDDINELYSSVPDHGKWTIYADNSRPDTISYLARKHQLNIKPCDKGKDSVEEGIAYLRKFPVIHVHQRCKHVLDEMKSYSYKTDSKTGEVLPIVIDKNNHCIDALRYALCKKIGAGGVDWESFVG